MIDQGIIDNIGKMIVNGNRLELPKDEQFTNYPQLKKVLLDAKGKYSKCGFTFPGDAADIQRRLCGGEELNNKKKLQQFFTPPELAEKVVKMADIYSGMRVLEPSAGPGALAIEARPRCHTMYCVEIDPDNCAVLRNLGFHVFQMDFLALEPAAIGMFDRIVANPPFTKNQDIDHFRHMLDFLKPGGRLVCIMSPSWTFGSQKKQVQFRLLLEEIGATVEEVEAGAFKASGTNIRSVIVTFNRPR